MSPANSLERILEDIKENKEVFDVSLVSRSGKHIAGEVPREAHMETYVAMSAILLGSAETATSELEDRLKYVLVELENSRILIQDSGESAILVTRLEDGAVVEDVLELTKEPIGQIKRSL
ncbi:MAG: roadblock/LC7 domain-containing protein [Candidatus Thermoplasmatota archaeon]